MNKIEEIEILKKLENRLHTQIPMTKFMHLKLESLDNEKLISTIPLEQNINDKGTAFAGSSNTLSIISGWSLSVLITEKLKFNNTMIAIIKNQSSFIAPLSKDLVCHTYLPKDEEIERLNQKLLTKRSASIRIKSKIIEDEKVCLDFEGIYVIKLN